MKNLLNAIDILNNIPALIAICAGLVLSVVAVVATLVIKKKRSQKLMETFDWQVASVAKQEIVEEEEEIEELALILNDEDDEEDESSDKVAYKRSYFSKLVQSSDELKSEYNHFKNVLLSYGRSRSRFSWYYESFYVNKFQFARLIFRGKTLCLCIAIDYDVVKDNFKNLENMSGASRYKETPTLMRLKNPKNFRDATKLVETYMSLNNVEQGSVESIDYVPAYMTDEELLANKYIRPLEITQGPTPKSAKEELDELDLSGDIEDDEVEILVDNEGNVEEIKFKRSMQSRIIQSNDVCKFRYNAIKNAFLSNKAITSKYDWAYELFHLDGKEIGKINVKNNRLYVSLPLPVPTEDVSYPYVDNSTKKAYKNTPLTLVVKTNKTARLCIKFIRQIIADNGLTSHLHKFKQDYTMPYQSSLQLEKQGLVKFTDKDQEELYRTKWDKDLLESKIFAEHENYFADFEKDFSIDVEKLLLEETKVKRSVMAKLIQADLQTKECYRKLAEKLLSIKGVKMRTSWSVVKFSLRGQAIAYLTLKGKKLKLYLALRPASFDKKVYHHTNAPKARRYETTPMAVTASGKRAFTRALKLIDVMVEKNGYSWGKPKSLPVEQLFYQSDSQLLESGLVKEVKESIAVAQRIPSIEDIYGPHVYLRKSFYARLVQERAEVKKAYVQLVEHLSTFKRLKYKALWGSETWTYRKDLMAKAVFKNDRLVVFFNVDPKNKALRKLRTENRSRYASCKKTPTMIRLDKLEDIANAKAVADVVFADLQKGDVVAHTRSLKKVGTMQLIQQGQIRVSKLPDFLIEKLEKK